MTAKYTVYRDGTMRLSRRREDYPDMAFPCLCTCGEVFDLGAVEVRQRYSDCTVFLLPCCNRTTDDRPAGWRSGPNFERLI